MLLIISWPWYDLKTHFVSDSILESCMLLITCQIPGLSVPYEWIYRAVTQILNCWVCTILLSLRNRTGEGRSQQTLCDKPDNNFVRKKLFTKQTLLYFTFNRSFCKRSENINVKWGSLQNMQVIALSHLLHTSILLSPSSCHPIA